MLLLLNYKCSCLKIIYKKLKISKNSIEKKKQRGHPGLNQGPLDLQSNALPLSYAPYLLKQL